MASVVVDDHLLRDVLTATRPPDLKGIAPDGIATTGLWLFRLSSSLANPTVRGKLTAPVSALPAVLQTEFDRSSSPCHPRSWFYRCETSPGPWQNSKPTTAVEDEHCPLPWSKHSPRRTASDWESRCPTTTSDPTCKPLLMQTELRSTSCNDGRQRSLNAPSLSRPPSTRCADMHAPGGPVFRTLGRTFGASPRGHSRPCRHEC